jgi:hypothetical protein
MRVSSTRPVAMLGGDRPEELVPAEHPICRVKPLADPALRDLEPTFDRICARPRVPRAH